MEMEAPRQVNGRLGPRTRGWSESLQKRHARECLSAGQRARWPRGDKEAALQSLMTGQGPSGATFSCEVAVGPSASYSFCDSVSSSARWG